MTIETRQADIRGILMGAVVAMFLAALDQTIVAPALPTIGRELGEMNSISWVVTAYLICSTAATPLFGKLSDLHGRRPLLLAAIGIFIVGSIGCALAPNMLTLILSRGLQGIGGGGLLALPNTIIADVVSPRDRGKYQGYFASVYALSSVAGPVLGGVLTAHLSWTVIFWINLPLGLLAAFISYRSLAHVKAVRRQHQIDWLGALLMISATVTLLLALTWGGHRFAWNSPEITAMLAAAVLLTGIFAVVEARAAEPVLPLGLLANPIVRLTSAIGFLIVMINTSISIFVPLYLELTRGMVPDRSGLVLIAPMISVVAGAAISGQYMRLAGRYKMPPAVGSALAAAALGAFALWGEGLGLTGIVTAFALAGLGLGTSFPALMVATQNAVDVRELGTATASQAFFRSLGGATGVAMFSALLLGVVASSVGGELARGDLADILSQTAGDVSRPVLEHGFRLVFGAAAILTALAALGFAVMREIPLRAQSAQAAQAARASAE